MKCSIAFSWVVYSFFGKCEALGDFSNPEIAGSSTKSSNVEMVHRIVLPAFVIQVSFPYMDKSRGDIPVISGEHIKSLCKVAINRLSTIYALVLSRWDLQINSQIMHRGMYKSASSNEVVAVLKSGFSREISLHSANGEQRTLFAIDPDYPSHSSYRYSLEFTIISTRDSRTPNSIILVVSTKIALEYKNQQSSQEAFFPVMRVGQRAEHIFVGQLCDKVLESYATIAKEHKLVITSE